MKRARWQGKIPEDVKAVDERDAEQVYLNLKRIVTEGGRQNFLIVSVGDVYVQFSCGCGSVELVCEGFRTAKAWV